MNVVIPLSDAGNRIRVGDPIKIQINGVTCDGHVSVIDKVNYIIHCVVANVYDYGTDADSSVNDLKFRQKRWDS